MKKAAESGSGTWPVTLNVTAKQSNVLSLYVAAIVGNSGEIGKKERGQVKTRDLLTTKK